MMKMIVPVMLLFWLVLYFSSTSILVMQSKSKDSVGLTKLTCRYFTGKKFIERSYSANVGKSKCDFTIKGK